MASVLARGSDQDKLQKTTRRHEKQTTICEPEAEASEGANPADTLIRLLTSRAVRKTRVLLKLPRLWSALTAAPGTCTDSKS